MIKKISTLLIIGLFSVIATQTALAYNVTVDPTLFGYKEGTFGPKKKSITFSMLTGAYWNGIEQNFPQGVSRINDIWRYGLRLGYQVNETFGIESHLAFTPTINDNFDIFVYDAALVGHVDLEMMERFYLFGLVGPGMVYVNTPNLNSFSKFAVHYGAGLKYFVFKNLNVRAEFRAITTFEGINTAFAPTLGVQYYFQGQRNRSDVDGDGIKNAVDQCIDVPETFNGFQDEDGCPEDINDWDGDGIANKDDKCPKAAETINGALDEDGCPENPNDWDEDGIFNKDDKCPKDPETKNGYKDEDGCPEDVNDWDGDRIANNIDKCPKDPETINGVADDDGCPENPNDIDGDGIINENDKCPKQPETINGLDDLDGCPDQVPNDSDGDGVRDDKDQCPGPKEVYNDYKDDDGCPDHELDEFSGVVEGIHFNTGKSTILIDSYAKLNKGADLFQKYPALKFVIEGHTDSTGSMKVNMKLSKERAESVRDYLANRGIDLTRMTIEAFGPSKPIATNATREGRARNRRIEFKLLNLEEVKKSAE